MRNPVCASFLRSPSETHWLLQFYFRFFSSRKTGLVFETNSCHAELPNATAKEFLLEGLRSRKPEPPTLWRLPVTCRLIQHSSDFLPIRVSVNEVPDFAPERRRSERLQQKTNSGPG